MKRENLVSYFDDTGKELTKKEFLALQKDLIVGEAKLIGKSVSDGLISSRELQKVIKKQNLVVIKYKGKKYIK